MEGGGAQASGAVGETVRRKAAILWAAMAVLLFAAVMVGGLAVFRANKPAQAGHDVQVIALALDGFA